MNFCLQIGQLARSASRWLLALVIHFACANLGYARNLRSCIHSCTHTCRVHAFGGTLRCRGMHTLEATRPRSPDRSSTPACPLRTRIPPIRAHTTGTPTNPSSCTQTCAASSGHADTRSRSISRPRGFAVRVRSVPVQVVWCPPMAYVRSGTAQWSVLTHARTHARTCACTFYTHVPTPARMSMHTTACTSTSECTHVRNHARAHACTPFCPPARQPKKSSCGLPLLRLLPSLPVSRQSFSSPYLLGPGNCISGISLV